MFCVVVDFDCDCDNPWTLPGCICSTRAIAEREEIAARAWFERVTEQAPEWFLSFDRSMCERNRTRLYVWHDMWEQEHQEIKRTWDVRVVEAPYLDA